MDIKKPHSAQSVCPKWWFAENHKKNTHLKQLLVLKATKTPEIVEGFSFLSKTLDVFVARC